jgi:hypothetical protein
MDVLVMPYSFYLAEDSVIGHTVVVFKDCPHIVIIVIYVVYL